MAPVHTAAGSIRAGMDRVVIAGGAESITQSPHVMKKLPGSYSGVQPWLSPSHPATPDAPTMDMSITVGWNTAQSRPASPARSRTTGRTTRTCGPSPAIDEGRSRDEIFAMEVPVPGKRGETRTFDTDEHPRRDTTMEKLAKLPPLHPEIDGFSVTAGQLVRASTTPACAMVVADSDYAQEHGLEPLAIVRSWASVGVPPARHRHSRRRSRSRRRSSAPASTSATSTLVEINEAFASMAVASSRDPRVRRTRS